MQWLWSLLSWDTPPKAAVGKLPVSLTFLDLTNTGLGDISLGHLLSLRTLWLDNTRMTGRAFAKKGRALTHLSLRNCRELQTLDQLPSTLLWLDLRDTEITERLLRPLSRVLCLFANGP